MGIIILAMLATCIKNNTESFNSYYVCTVHSVHALHYPEHGYDKLMLRHIDNNNIRFHMKIVLTRTFISWQFQIRMKRVAKYSKCLDQNHISNLLDRMFYKVHRARRTEREKRKGGKMHIGSSGFFWF